MNSPGGRVGSVAAAGAGQRPVAGMAHTPDGGTIANDHSHHGSIVLDDDAASDGTAAASTRRLLFGGPSGGIGDTAAAGGASPTAGARAGALSGAAASRLRKWTSFASTVLCMLCGGTLYLFGTYSSELRATLGYTQTQMNMIASAGGFGLYLSGPIVGAAVDKHGARRIVLAASVLLWAGYTGMAWTLSGAVPWTNFGVTAFFYMLVGLGSSGCYNSALKTNIQNFEPKDHGFAVGVSVSAFGLSALVFSSISRAFVLPTSSEATGHDFAARSAAAPVGSAGAPKLDAVRFLMFMGLATGLINLVAGLVGLQDLSKQSSAARRNSNARPSAHAERDSDREEDDDIAHGHSHGHNRSSPAVTAVRPSQPILLRSVILRDSDAWHLFLPFMTLAGLGLMYINNVGSIVLALVPGESGSVPVSSAQALMVSLISLFNCLGRIVTGIVSDKAQLHYGTSRMFFLTAGAMIILAAQLIGLLLVTNVPTLLLCTCLLGFGYGSIFSSTPAIVSQWFGVQTFGSNWGYFQVGPAMGGYIWNLVFGLWMDSQKSGHGPGAGGLDGPAELPDCKGVGCFRGAFAFASLAAALSVVSLLQLSWRRSRQRYAPLL
ncbi:major facilitator superfamily domain-containing protein [Entophlyctis helioformis]|nr:major facilitator superfamily domain-containing protein [Entophlyctis helioformis]